MFILILCDLFLYSLVMIYDHSYIYQLNRRFMLTVVGVGDEGEYNYNDWQYNSWLEKSFIESLFHVLVQLMEKSQSKWTLVNILVLVTSKSIKDVNTIMLVPSTCTRLRSGLQVAFFSWMNCIVLPQKKKKKKKTPIILVATIVGSMHSKPCTI